MRTTLAHHPSNAESIILATVCLHNFVMNKEEHLQGFKQYCPSSYVDHEDNNHNIVPGEWRREPFCDYFQNIGRLGGNRGALVAIHQRDTIAKYFLSEEGQVPWQWQTVYRGFDINMP